MDAETAELREVLVKARELLALPDNRFDWSAWEDAESALREMDGLIAALEQGRVPHMLSVTVLFAPTGPIQEVSISSGWAAEFLGLAARFDRAVGAFYHTRGHGCADS